MIDFVEEMHNLILVYRETGICVASLCVYIDEWVLDSVSDDYCLTSEEMRQIADKLDELNK